MRWLDGVTDVTDKNWGRLQGKMRGRRPGVPQATGPQSMGHDWAAEQQPSSYVQVFLASLVI